MLLVLYIFFQERKPVFDFNFLKQANSWGESRNFMISPECWHMLCKSLGHTHTHTHTPLILMPCAGNSLCMLQLQLNSLNVSEEVKWALHFSVAAQIQTPLPDSFYVFNLKIQTGRM